MQDAGTSNICLTKLIFLHQAGRRLFAIVVHLNFVRGDLFFEEHSRRRFSSNPDFGNINAMSSYELPDIPAKRIISELAEPACGMPHPGEPNGHISLSSGNMLVKTVHILKGNHPVRCQKHHGFPKGYDLHCPSSFCLFTNRVSL